MRAAQSALLVALVALCAAGCAHSTDPGRAGDPCSRPADCEDGMACVASQCAPACTTDADCDIGFHCARQTRPAESSAGCLPDMLRLCSETDCAEWGEVCIDAVCRAPVLGAASCRLDEAGDDGCGREAVCLAADDATLAPACYHMAACSADCRRNHGVCNDARIPSKAEICLADLCLSSADCASGECFKDRAADPFGRCMTSMTTRVRFGDGYHVAYATTSSDAVLCPTSDSNLPGTRGAGDACSQPVDCAPMCCDCAGGGAVLAAGCFHGACAPASELCSVVGDRCAP